MNHIWKCKLCDEFVPDYKLLNHIRLMHPDIEADYDKWPDGEPVILEDADEFFL